MDAAKVNTGLMTLALLAATVLPVVAAPPTLVVANSGFTTCERRCRYLCAFAPVIKVCYEACLKRNCPGGEPSEAPAHCDLGCATSKCNTRYYSDAKQIEACLDRCSDGCGKSLPSH